MTELPPSPAPARWTDAEHPLWRWLLAACALASAAALLAGPFLPSTDLPQHVAMIATLRHWFDPAWRFQELFTLDLGRTQYLLYYLAGAALSVPLGSAERANLALLALIAISFPYSLRALLRALGHDERLALFGAALFFNQSLLIGFFNYLAALPVTLYALALVVRHANAPTTRRGWRSPRSASSSSTCTCPRCSSSCPRRRCALCSCRRPRPEARFPSLASCSTASPACSDGCSGSCRWESFASSGSSKARSCTPTRSAGRSRCTRASSRLKIILRHIPESLIDIWQSRVDDALMVALGLAALWMLSPWPRRETKIANWSARRRGSPRLVRLPALLRHAALASAGSSS